MKIILAPDSFKGSLSAVEVCRAMTAGVGRLWPEVPPVSVPLADGGEGTLDALIAGTDVIEKNATVHGPLDTEVEARWGILPDGTAIIEMAQASGLPLLSLEARDALAASTWGTGQLIKKALDAGCRRFLIGLGGSATTDGGTGALAALGMRFFDENDVVLPLGGGALSRLKRIDAQFFDARIQNSEFIVLCDVTNPLYGENGASQVFAPQKGASQAQVQTLDSGLRNLAEVTQQTLGHDWSQTPGAGAAGGFGFGLLAFCGARLQSGIETILETSQFGSKIQGADLILTGEGSLDSQTLGGKTIAGVCAAARQAQVPVIAFGGAVRLSGAEMNQLGLQSAFSIVDGARSLEFCLENASTLLTDSVERALRLWR